MHPIHSLRALPAPFVSNTHGGGLGHNDLVADPDATIQFGIGPSLTLAPAKVSRFTGTIFP